MKRRIYIILFSLLYLSVAGTSFWHAIQFFNLANNYILSIILAASFEVGQAAVLLSLLTTQRERSKIMPWVLMSMFTLVQVLGNVFSSYKHIMLNSVEDLKYFKEPIFIWTDIPDQMATVIVTYLIGALLPISSLLLTSILVNYLEDTGDGNVKPNAPEALPLPVEEDPVTEAPTTQAPTTVMPTTVSPTTQAPTTTDAPTTQAPTTVAPTTVAPTTTEAPTTVLPTTQVPTTESPQMKEESPLDYEMARQSHFINL